MPAKVVSIINLKGGVGKSTLTMMLGEYLSFEFAQDVLLIDMDAQANLSYCMMAESAIQRQNDEGRTIYHLFQRALRGENLDIREFITQPRLVVSNIARSGMLEYDTNLSMVVSTPSVAQLDEELLELWENDKPMPQGIRQTLVDALAPVMDDYEYVLIDCPPGLSIFSSAALMASDYYVSPVIPEPLSLQGVNLVNDRVVQLRSQYDSKVEFRGVMLNIVKHYRNTHSTQAEEIYTSGKSRYLPFSYWLPDNERLRRLGEFDPDLGGSKWAAGMDSKFSNIHDKYGLPYRLRNPADGFLSRRNSEGSEYRLEGRISSLASEFRQRCRPQFNS